MTKQQCIKILKEHNAWRRGADGEQANPISLGMAIDYAVAELSKGAKIKKQ